jgi:hypothetical protein
VAVLVVCYSVIPRIDLIDYLDMMHSILGIAMID